jgi:hypothetical protein
MPWKPAYVTATDLKAFLDITDSVDDARLGFLAEAASRQVDEWCNRQFGQTGLAARVYYGPAYYHDAAGLWCVEVDDIQNTTGLLVGGVSLATSGGVLLPVNAAAEGVPFERIGFTSAPTMPLTVTAAYGWNTVPQQVQEAVKLQASRLSARRTSPFGVAGSPDQGSEIRLSAKLDVDARGLLSRLKRRARGA